MVVNKALEKFYFLMYGKISLSLTLINLSEFSVNSTQIILFIFLKGDRREDFLLLYKNIVKISNLPFSFISFYIKLLEIIV